MKRLILWMIALLLLAAGCAAPAAPAQVPQTEAAQAPAPDASEQTEESKAPDASQSPSEVADYLREHGVLPDYYLTKAEARDLGWASEDGNLWEVAEGRVIGGDRFGNREGLLPDRSGRSWYEADVNYAGGYRGPERLVFSDDGLIFYTGDHYDSFDDWTEESP